MDGGGRGGGGRGEGGEGRKKRKKHVLNLLDSHFSNAAESLWPRKFCVPETQSHTLWGQSSWKYFPVCITLTATGWPGRAGGALLPLPHLQLLEAGPSGRTGSLHPPHLRWLWVAMLDSPSEFSRRVIWVSYHLRNPCLCLSPLCLGSSCVSLLFLCPLVQGFHARYLGGTQWMILEPKWTEIAGMGEYLNPQQICRHIADQISSPIHDSVKAPVP